MRDAGRHREQPIDQPALAGRERGMRRTHQPLGQADNVFEARFLRSDRECNRALNHVRFVRRTKIGALDVPQRVGDALDIAYVGDRNLGPLRLQPRAAAIFPVHQGADAIAGLQSFGSHDVAGLSGRAGDNDPWLDHDCLLSTRITGPQFCPVPIALAFALKNSSNVSGSRPVTTRMASVALKCSSPFRKYCQRCVK